MIGLKSLMMAASLAFLVPAAYAGAPANGTAKPMMQMQGRLQQMQRTMDRIRATKNPRERRRLLRQHMREMQKAMSMMGSCMMGGGMMGGGKGGMMGGGKGKAMGHGASPTPPRNPCGMKSAASKGARMSPERMQTMMKRMAKHQQMMQMMMKQMMEHMGARGGGK
ncbi:hypothetical protein BMS3Abin12_01391 [bacterium BMS3Abin12]|nr:hypothetical protein BMS3Abin12_01391 [bacterium BMS3Abin12]